MDGALSSTRPAANNIINGGTKSILSLSVLDSVYFLMSAGTDFLPFFVGLLALKSV